MAAPSRRRARDDAPPPAPVLVISGGHAEPPRTVDKYRRGVACDAVLYSACGTDFHVHRVVVMGKSEYFEGLYNSEMSDASGEVTLSQISAAALSACIEWIYVGSAPVASDPLLFTLLEAAIYLRIDDLVRAAAAAATSRLGPSTALVAWSVAEPQPELAALAAAAQRIACYCFSTIVASAAWTSAPSSLVHALLADDRLAVTKEEEVYAAAMAWLSACTPPLSAPEATRLLALIRFARLEAAFVLQVVRREPRLQTAEGQTVLLDAFQAAWFGAAARARQGAKRGFLFVMGGIKVCEGGVSEQNLVNSIERYDVDANRWQLMPNMPTARYAFGAAVIGDKIYVVGGRAASSGPQGLEVRLTTMDCFDIVTQTWEAMPRMPRRDAFDIAVLDRKLILVGGTNSNGALAEMHCFDPHTRTWEAMPPMPTRRVNTSCSATTVDGKLYVVGGRDATSRALLTTVERYDPATRMWESMPSMATARASCAIAVLDGHLYAVGGMGPAGWLDSMERFDPATNAWAPMPLMALKHAAPKAAALDGKIYVQGGAVAGQTVRHDLLEVFNPASDDPLSSWSTTPLSESTVRRGHAGVVAWQPHT